MYERERPVPRLRRIAENRQFCSARDDKNELEQSFAAGYPIHTNFDRAIQRNAASINWSTSSPQMAIPGVVVANIQ
jgi:hypothetical protein